MEDTKSYSHAVKKLRSFFQDKYDFLEVPVQSRLSILAACEDPKTISKFVFGGTKYPLPQTGQMWLEYELLKDPSLPGVFCISTSYRDEPNPIEGRHDKIFPMFEFEAKGNIGDLRDLESRLLHHLGFGDPRPLLYEDACREYEVDTLEAEHEEMIQNDYGNIIFLEKFPQRTHPFWNMRHAGNGIYNKVDVLLYGMETIGSAERSTNVDEMRNNFLTISDGEYARLLFDSFTEKRVMKELDNYLSLEMFPRFGGGIGVTRMTRAMKLADLMTKEQKEVRIEESSIGKNL